MLDALTFQAYAEQCAPQIHHATMSYLVKQESSFNPYAIGIVGGKLQRQPTNLAEAVATVNDLISKGIKFSAGIGQVFVGNWKNLGLDARSVFDVCKNLGAAQTIFISCHDRAVRKKGVTGQAAIEYALSCYYSNNFTAGYKEQYVQKIIKHAYDAQRRL